MKEPRLVVWDKSWTKIAVGISFYRWKTKLVVGSKSRRNLTIESSHSCWGSIMVVGSHPTSIWTIRCTWNWPLELRPNLDRQINAGKLEAIRSAIGGGCRFFEKISEINWNIADFFQLEVIFKKYSRYFSDFWRNFWIFLLSTFCRPLSFRWRPKHIRHFQPWFWEGL